MKNNIFTILLTLFSFNCVAEQIEQLADPTMPATYNANDNNTTTTVVTSPQQPINKTKLVLNSTIVAPSHKVAIINGVQLKIGDDINGAIIRHIDHQQVKLQKKDGEIVTLSLQKSFISDMKSSAP